MALKRVEVSEDENDTLDARMLDANSSLPDADSSEPDADSGVPDAGPVDGCWPSSACATNDAVPTGDGSSESVDATGERPPEEFESGSSGVGRLRASPAVPPWDNDTISHVAEVRSRGEALGNRPSVFAKAGDSLTASANFLQPLGPGNYDLGDYAALENTIEFFRTTTFSDGTNSFSHDSLAANSGWTASRTLGPPDVLASELASIRPAYVIVMFGTNDLETLRVDPFRASMDTILSETEAAGVPIMSTIPQRPTFDASVNSFNDAVRQLATAHHVPLIDLFAALVDLPDEGLGGDREHLSVETLDGSNRAGDFRPAGLQYGYNVRNLTFIQVFDRLRQLP